MHRLHKPFVRVESETNFETMHIHLQRATAEYHQNLNLSEPTHCLLDPSGVEIGVRRIRSVFFSTLIVSCPYVRFLTDK